MTAPVHGGGEGQPLGWTVNVGFEDKRKLRNRLRRIEGQVRGLQRMVEEETRCADILTQLGSVVSAVEHVGLLVFRHQAEQHIHESRRGGEEVREHLEELICTLDLLLRTDGEATEGQGRPRAGRPAGSGGRSVAESRRVQGPAPCAQRGFAG